MVQPGEPIVKEGAPGNSMFVIVDGEADVVRQTARGRERGRSPHRQKQALRRDGPKYRRTRGWPAWWPEPTVMLELTRKALEEVIARHPWGEVAQQFYRERLFTDVLRSNPLFALLPEELQRPVIDAFQSLLR